jgi:hypothetical protein
VRAVIDVLAAEIPHLQRDLVLARTRQSRRDDRDAMGGIAVGLKRQACQPSTELRLADSAVAENHCLDFSDGLDALLLVKEMGTELGQTIFIGLRRENLRGNAGNARFIET